MLRAFNRGAPLFKIHKILNVFVTTTYPKTVATWTPLASAFNSKPEIKHQYSICGKDVGLFGIKELKDPSGFTILKDRAVLKVSSLVREALDPNRTRKMVQIFDDLSDMLCQVADLAEFVRIGHPDRKYCQAADNALCSVSMLVEELNTHQELYHSLKRVVTEGDIFPTTSIDDHVAKLFLFDFEQSGIHLDKNKRERVVELNDNIFQYGTNFLEASLQPRIISRSQLAESHMHHFSKDGDTIQVSEIHADSSNESLREAAYKAFLFPDEKQSKLLDKLLASRHELAVLCGYESFAHRAIGGSIAGNPHNVNQFLKLLSINLYDKAQLEYSQMAEEKIKMGSYSKVLNAWDVPYYSSLLRNLKCRVAGTDIMCYFSLGACMEGLNLLASKLYGLTFEVETLDHGEAWHSDVIKLAVKESSNLLGHIYCDFYERSGKPNQDCHFTIRGGRKLADGSYQTPIVVLMLNLPNPSWRSPSLLLPSMVDNLFHEMGHALHSMMARTSYQHVTGTRCSTDLAELPSILMEYFSSDPRVVSKFARHYKTGKTIPPNILSELEARKHLMSSSEAQLQVFYGHLDQAFHGSHPLKGSTMDIIADVQQKYHGITHVPNTAWHLRFGHLVGYGAKYYAYSLSRALASWVWHAYFKQDPLNSKMGDKYRREVLSHGAEKAPTQLIEDYLQEAVTPESLCKAFLKDFE